MSWLTQWPEEFHKALVELAERQKYTEIHKIQELSGGGGARTFRAAPGGDPGIANRIIIKVGPQVVVTEDVKGLEEAKKYFRDAHYSLTNPIEFDGMGCCAMVDVSSFSGQSFHDFYLQTKEPEVVTRIIDDLFRNVLRRGGASPLTVHSTPENVFQLYQFNNARALSSELQNVGDDVPTLGDWWERAREKCEYGTFKILSHGDLHAGNIIIAHGRPCLIDFGQTGYRHVMLDLAKFERDIRLVLTPLEQQRQLNSAEQPPAEAEGSGHNAEFQKACQTIEVIRRNARASLPPESDWEFEYLAALLAQFIFAAADTRRPPALRHAALSFAHELRAKLAPKVGPVFSLAEKELAQRKEVLWRVAYAFLRLEQLPSGGWSKTLPNWMEAIWEGENGEISRNPKMRTKGGTDLSGYAFQHYVDFLNNHFDLEQVAWLVRHNGVAQRLLHVFESDIGLDGGIGLSGRADAQVRLRHTLMGMLTFLAYVKANNFGIKPIHDLRVMAQYLITNLRKWKHDKSHLFGMFVSLVKLAELLDQTAYAKLFEAKQLQKLRRLIQEVRQPMRESLDGANECEPKPTCGLTKFHTLPFFTPYANFWRMERSSFLMYLPLLISEDGERFLEPELQTRCKQCLIELLDDILIPFDLAQPTASLLYYHPDRQAEHGIHRAVVAVPRDWGLSAELAAALELPVIRALLAQQVELEGKRAALHSALLYTFDAYNRRRDVFKFTQGIAFSRYKKLVALGSISATAIKRLDAKLTELCAGGVTEDHLDKLLETIIADAGIPPEINKNGWRESKHALRDMLVDKLESGEHTPDKDVCPQGRWLDRVENILKGKMLGFYDGDGGRGYAARYQESPISTFVSRIRDFVKWPRERGKYIDRRAIDVGCGPGHYAKMMADEGFAVELVDVSVRMLEMASQLLGLSVCPPTRDIYDLRRDFSTASFDLVFACAMMVHVPLDRADDIYQSFYHLLKPGGILFVNYKLRDHSLISADGRFFQYYRDYMIPMKALQETGFVIEEVVTRWNRKNMYDDPKVIQWANFYCKKPE